MVGVLLSNENDLSLSNLLYWADTGALSIHNAVLTLPKIMKPSPVVDRFAFDYQERSESALRTHVIRLIGNLDLGTIDLNGKSGQAAIFVVLERLLKELSLPKQFLLIIKKSLANTDLFKLKQRLPVMGMKRDSDFNFITLEKRYDIKDA